MKSLPIDRALFDMAFNVDQAFQAYSVTGFLNLDSGEIVWVYADDGEAEMDGMPARENATRRRQAKAAHYVAIPGKSHGDHHELLKAFLDSPWTDDVNRANWAKNSYWGSIGAWKKNVLDENIIQEFEAYRDRQLDKLALDFLARHDIEPEWR